jgi:hypothetical protein
MFDALFMLGVCFLVAIVTAAMVSLAFVARLQRRCTTLEWAVGDLQDRASTFKGRDMAEKRWKKNGELEAAMAQTLQSAPAPSRKYDNDPLG